MKYSLSRNGQIIGSYTLDELRAHLQTGNVLPSDHVLPEGGSQWVTVAQVLPGVSGASVAPGAPPPPPSVPEKPKNYLVQSILVTLFCCLPFGVVAIVYSAQVDSKYRAGDYAGALHASKRASMWGWISFGIGIVVGVCYGIIGALGAVAGAHG
jgi:hypothetical protein